MGTNNMNAIKKSNNETRIEDTGMINRGKYIFLIILELFTMLLDALVKPEEKMFQIKRPEKTYMG